jgi:predicted nucleic acid-binding protein
VITADTNVFVYSIDVYHPAKHRSAAELVDALAAQGAPLGLQVVGEFYAAVAGRLRRPPWETAQAARNLMRSFRAFGATQRSTERALAEAATGRFSFWDANLLSAAEEAGCTHMITEDMGDGVRLGRLEVVHPFTPHGDLSQKVRDLLFRQNRR